MDKILNESSKIEKSIRNQDTVIEASYSTKVG
jgi:hypothetical protein